MILAALSDYYEKLEENEKVASIGYATAPISYALVISSSGKLVDIEDLRDVSGKKLGQGILLCHSKAREPQA
ncbi:hypothetical protein GCM10011502_29090 [Oceanisphaera marina]|uniref:IclR-ED domain-containing protein n=1 Tax=Oceanisphaera marina TaxID=2017550 RepID=A0ABQ1IZ68_9GAMM|nr:hypothetical protein GCM10011502_29090 [Oceanisphaera marina]